MKRFASATRPVLLVLGNNKSRVEKCIATLAETRVSTTQNATSIEAESPSIECSSRWFKLNGKDVELVNVPRNVTQNLNIRDVSSHENFLKLMEATGKAPFYPPLIFADDAEYTDKEWLQGFRSAFPSVVLAVECSKERYATVQASSSQSLLGDAPLFYVNEIVDAEDGDGPSHARFVEDLEKICSHYSTLTPTRDDMDFNSELFQGDFEKVKNRTETDEKDVKTEELVTRVDNQPNKRRRVVRLSRGGYMKQWVDMNERERNLAFQFISDAISSFLREEAWVPQSEDVIEDLSVLLEKEVTYRRTLTVRSHLARDVNDLYKVLRNGSTIYCGEVEEEWKEIRDEIIDEAYDPVSSS